MSDRNLVCTVFIRHPTQCDNKVKACLLSQQPYVLSHKETLGFTSTETLPSVWTGPVNVQSINQSSTRSRLYRESSAPVRVHKTSSNKSRLPVALLTAFQLRCEVARKSDDRGVTTLAKKDSIWFQLFLYRPCLSSWSPVAVVSSVRRFPPSALFFTIDFVFFFWFPASHVHLPPSLCSSFFATFSWRKHGEILKVCMFPGGFIHSKCPV